MLIWAAIALIPMTATTPDELTREFSPTAEQITQHEELEFAAVQTKAELMQFKMAVGMAQTTQSPSAEVSMAGKAMPKSDTPGMAGAETDRTAVEQQLADIRQAVWDLYDRIQEGTSESNEAITSEINSIQNDVEALRSQLDESRQSLATSFHEMLEVAERQVNQDVDLVAAMLENAITEFNTALRVADFRDRLSALRQELAQGTEREMSEVTADIRELKRDIESFTQTASSEVQEQFVDVISDLEGLISALETGSEDVIERIDSIIESMTSEEEQSSS